MKHLLALAVVAGIGVAGASQAHATTAAAVAQIDPAASVQLVSGGCGPRGFRDRFGRCRPARYAPPPPVRGCPPGYHRSAYGCRRNF